MGIDNQHCVGLTHRAVSQSAQRSVMGRSGADSDAGSQGPY